MFSPADRLTKKANTPSKNPKTRVTIDPRLEARFQNTPSRKVAVMGGAQAATVMEIITRASFAKKGLPVQEDALKAMGEHIRKRLDHESSALFATARLWDDGIIDPRDTRDVLAFVLRTIDEADRRTLRPNTFGVARL